MDTRRIPLFPLNVVLFPGMALPLHIFEPRYQEMIGRCLREDRLFGVCLIAEGEEVGDSSVRTHRVGTTCEILSVTRLDGGRLNLVTIGRRRFQVKRVIREKSYLEAEVALLADDETGELADLPGRVRTAAARYVSLLLARHGERPRSLDLPRDPLALSCLVGAVLQAPLAVRQELLEMSVVAERLLRQLSLLESDIEELERQAENATVIHPFRPDQGGISLN
jgi:Lon protease-like protein